MKRVQALVLLAAFLVLLIAALAPALSGSQVGSQACAPPAFIESEAGYVICCCRTFTGMCCAEVTFCSGFVPGCFCTG